MVHHQGEQLYKSNHHTVLSSPVQENVVQSSMYVLQMRICTQQLEHPVGWYVCTVHNLFLNEMRRLLFTPNLFFLWCCSTTRSMASSVLKVLDHTQRLTTVGRTPLDEWSARRRDLYLTTHNTHNRQTSMSTVGFEPTISADERPQTHALDRAATGTGAHTN